MENPLKQDSRRIIWFLVFAVVVAVLGRDAHAQQNTITGYNQIVGQWNASQAARTNNSRTGTGSPVGRDDCLRIGESYFQTDATAGQNNWYCVAAGSPGSWVIAIGPITVGASLPATCTVGQQYFVTTSGATYGLNVCTATNTWTAQSGASGSGTVTSVSASCLFWLTCPVATATTTPALAIGAATSQTSHQVIGTCGSATAFGPCALVAGDLPSISLTTGVIGTLQAAQEPAHTGDMTNTAGSLATTVVGLNGTNLAGLATGILMNTTGTGVPSIATASNFPTLNQNTTGTAANVTGVVAAANGGTGVNNAATLTLGTSNQNWASLGTGVVKNTTTTGALSNAAASDVYGLWSGTCSAATYLNGAGTCATPIIKSVLASNYTNSSSTPSTIISFNVVANATNVYHCHGLWQQANTSGYFGFTMTGPASPTSVVWDFQKENNVSSNSPTLLWYNGNGTSYPTSIGATGAGLANTDLSWDLTVSMTNGSTAGTVAFQGYSDGTHQLTVLAGSFCTQQ
jgi:hypothetical protein